MLFIIILSDMEPFRIIILILICTDNSHVASKMLVWSVDVLSK